MSHCYSNFTVSVLLTTDLTLQTVSCSCLACPVTTTSRSTSAPSRSSSSTPKICKSFRSSASNHSQAWPAVASGGRTARTKQQRTEVAASLDQNCTPHKLQSPSKGRRLRLGPPNADTTTDIGTTPYLLREASCETEHRRGEPDRGQHQFLLQSGVFTQHGQPPLGVRGERGGGMESWGRGIAHHSSQAAAALAAPVARRSARRRPPG